MNKYPDYKENQKLTKADVDSIRELCGKMSAKELAYKFNVNVSMISRIINNTRWVDKSKGRVCSKCGREFS